MFPLTFLMSRNTDPSSGSSQKSWGKIAPKGWGKIVEIQMTALNLEIYHFSLTFRQRAQMSPESAQKSKGKVMDIQLLGEHLHFHIFSPTTFT